MDCHRLSWTVKRRGSRVGGRFFSGWFFGLGLSLGSLRSRSSSGRGVDRGHSIVERLFVGNFVQIHPEIPQDFCEISCLGACIGGEHC